MALPAFANGGPGKGSTVSKISGTAYKGGVKALDKTTDVVNVGDAVKVKVIGFDERGKIKLSMRVVDQATGEDIIEKVGAKPGRGDRDRDRGDRRERFEPAPAEGAEQPAVGE